MADQELILRLKAAGAAEAVAALEGVAGAEQRVVDAVKKVQLESEDARPAADALAEAQGRLADLQERLAKAQSSGTVGDVRLLNAAIREQEAVVGALSPRVRTANVSFEAMSRILGQIDPELAGFAMNARGVVQLLGGMGAGTISAGIGFSALLFSIKIAVDEIRELRGQMKALADEATKREHDAMAAAQSISLASRKRPEGVFTPEEDRAAEQMFRIVHERVRDAELLKQNIAALQGVVSPQDILSLTQAGVEVPIDKTRAEREAMAREALGAPTTGERAERETELTRDQRERLREKALAEASTDSIGEGTAALEALIKDEMPGLPTSELPDVIFLIRERLRLERRSRKLKERGFGMTEQDIDERSISALHPFRRFLGFEGESEVVKQTAKRVVNMITYNQQGMRVYGPDTESRRARVKNGETAARDAERIGG